MTPQHDTGIYQQTAAGGFIAPFNLTYRPMQRLLLYNLKDAPHHKGIEPQWFDDDEHGRGLLVIVYRQDDTVDVHYTPGLKLDPRGYQIQAGLNAMLETDFNPARFEITPYGVEMEIGFHDIQGRRIEARLSNRRDTPRKGMRLLAPFGSTVQKPVKLIAVYLFDFDFIRRPVREMHLSVDGQTCRAFDFPLPLPGMPASFVRYSGEPMIVDWNEQMDGSLPLYQPSGAGEFRAGGTLFTLVDNGGHLELEQMKVASPHHAMALSFTPAFPSLRGLRTGASVAGRFRLLLDDSERICAGVYTAQRTGDLIELGLDIDQGWQPRNPAGLLRMVMLFTNVFKRWPTTYRWRGRLNLAGGSAHLVSGWERVTTKG